MKIKRNGKSLLVISLMLLVLVGGCTEEEATIACAPDEEECATETEEGFAIGTIPNATAELNPSELALLQRLLLEKIPFHSNGKLLGPKNVWLKLLKIVETWIETHLQKRITSLQMMREVIISNDLNKK